MGTHPIFESDFDCLTDFCTDFNSKWPATAPSMALPSTLDRRCILDEPSISAPSQCPRSRPRRLLLSRPRRSEARRTAASERSLPDVSQSSTQHFPSERSLSDTDRRPSPLTSTPFDPLSSQDQSSSSSPVPPEASELSSLSSSSLDFSSSLDHTRSTVSRSDERSPARLSPPPLLSTSLRSPSPSTSTTPTSSEPRPPRRPRKASSRRPRKSTPLLSSKRPTRRPSTPLFSLPLPPLLT